MKYSNDPFYKSTKWKNKRANVLRIHEYTCQECKRYGRTRPATVVHHVYPLEDYPEYKLLTKNLYSCCDKCHNSFHNRFTNELTEKGIRLMKRINLNKNELNLNL